MIGSRLGPYEVTASLGAGGMGEVYRAIDSRLKRQVAIKVLPAAFSADPERLARFEREAQLLAQLQHPNIASIYGLEEVNGSRALVMELVEGEDLAQRMARGALPLEEALPIARQIAEALEAAHDKGIVHRDLKPGNVKLTPDGAVKVLDFGLAKALEPASVLPGSLANSPTVTSAALAGGTQLGVILGTAAYMSPEQARGGAVDKRADVWAFGVVLFEMLTGGQLFAGETVSDTLAAVLRQEVAWEALPPSTPPAVRRLLRGCLERNPRNRLHDIADARIVLDDVASGRADEAATPGAAVVAPAPPRRALRVVWGVAAAAIAVAVTATAIAISASRSAAPPPAPSAVRFQLTPPDSLSPTRRGSVFTLSPDGRFLALTVDSRLWLRPLDAVTARRVEGTEDVTYPFWSPDGEWIGFFAEGQLCKMPRDGGPVQRLCAAPEGRGAAWSREGYILFSPDSGSGGVWRVSAQGGQPTRVTTVPEGARNQFHRYPQLLHDGRFLFVNLAPDPAVGGTYVAGMDGAAPVRVLEGSDQAVYAPSPGHPERGHLLYRRDTTLFARPFDLRTLRATGEAQPVAENVGLGANTGLGDFAVAANGLLAHRSNFADNGELVWVDRTGKRLEVLNDRTNELMGLALAADGRRLAYGTGRPADIWVQPLPTGEASRFTFGPSPGWAYPLWSPDGTELVFATWDLVGMPHYEIRRRRVDRGGSGETLLRSPETLYPWDWSPDGNTLVYSAYLGDLWLLPLTGERKPVLYREAPGEQAFGQFSPDGSLLAFCSNEQGRFEVFVGTVPASDAFWQLSSDGGSMPRWRADGRELFYRDNKGNLVAVTLGQGSGAAALDGRAAPRTLFAGIPSSGNTPIPTYVVAADGERFLIAASRSEDQPPITVVVNWQAGLAPAKEVP